jgi:hypothetical protein
MTTRTRILRFFTGLGLVLALSLAGFAIMLAVLDNWGTTAAERALVLPGDNSMPQPGIDWNHAITINAPPEAVWPWLAQIGDTRGGFYSYMFIEQAIAGSGLYINADRIHPEWQNPPVGQGMIDQYLAIAEYAPNQYLLARQTEAMEGAYLTWLWHLTPLGNNQTRMIVRVRIQMPVEAQLPFVGEMINLSGFVMQQKMLQGIQLRAEGGRAPAWSEPVEIALWLAALLVGLAAAWRFLTRPEWQRPLLVGLAVVVWLFVLTFVQPPLWLRAAGDLGLLAGLLWPDGLRHLDQKRAVPALTRA